MFTGGNTLDVPEQVAHQWSAWGWVGLDGLPDARGLTHPTSYAIESDSEPEPVEKTEAPTKAKVTSKDKVQRARREPRVKGSAHADE